MLQRWSDWPASSCLPDTGRVFTAGRHPAAVPAKCHPPDSTFLHQGRTDRPTIGHLPQLRAAFDECPGRTGRNDEFAIRAETSLGHSAIVFERLAKRLAALGVPYLDDSV